MFHAKSRWTMVVAYILMIMSFFLDSTLDPWSIFLFGVVGSMGHGISISVIYAYCMVGKIYVLDICLNLVIIKFVIRLLHIYIYMIAHDVLVWPIYYLKVYTYTWWCFGYGLDDGCVLSYNM